MKNNCAIITCKNPDLDGYACALGYAELLKKQHKNACAIILGQPLAEVIFVANYTKSKIFTSSIKDLKKFNTIILVDKSTLDPQHDFFNPKKVREIVDHRQVTETHLFSNAKLQIEQVGSCATLITEKFLHAKIRPKIPTSFFLYGAICSNTINFQNRITTKRDVRAAGYLKKLAKIPDSFISELFVAKSDLDGQKLIIQMRDDAANLEINNQKFIVFQIESMNCQNLIKKRINEIKKFTNHNYCFLNLIDIQKYFTTIIATDKKTKKILKDVLGVNFQDGVAKINHIIMRKEIIAKIQNYFHSR